MENWAVEVVRSVFNWVIALYADETFPYVIATWMLFVAVALIVIAGVKTFVQWCFTMRRGQAVKKIYKGCGDDFDQCREAFAKQYVDLSVSLKTPTPRWLSWSGIRGLRLAWSEFEESLVSDDADAAFIKNTIRPQTFFMGAVRPPNWLEFWANLAVGVGLFFTFFGLVAALYRANEGVASGDMTEMSASLAGLLAAASAKFVTSIMGVGLSLTLKAFHKFFASRLRACLADLCHKLETGLLYVAPQTIASQQLEQALEQTNLIKEQANEIGMQFREHLEPIRETLANSAEEQRQAIADGIGNMMGEAANAEIRHMSEMLNYLSGTLDGLGDGLRESGESASSQIREATAELVQTQKAFAASAEDLAKIGPVLDQWQAVTEGAAEKIDESLRSFAAVVAMMEDGVETMEEANASLRETIKDGVETMEEANAGLRETIKASDARIESGVDAIRKANDNAWDLAEMLRESQSEMNEVWTLHSDRFSDVDASLGEAVHGLSQGYQAGGL